MILYSFADRKHLRACRASGIAHGVIPWTIIPRDRGRTAELKSADTFQWLTTNQHFIDMESKDGPLKTAVLQGRKQEFRITVKIPKYGLGRLIRWTEFARKQQMPLKDHINLDLGKPSEWWIYAGVIPAKWFREISRNPTAPVWIALEKEREPLPMNTRGYGGGAYHPGNPVSLR